MDYNKESLKLHRKLTGKFSITPKMPLADKEALSLLYTPGVAEPCRQINENPESIYDYTAKGNLVAVVTDGTAVLGLGNIGAGAGLPVMEGKCILFKEFGGVDAVPICLDTEDPEDIIRVVRMMSPTFGGINLEDISAPRCFHIEERLKELLPIPVFHDDQHGTAIVTLAALINALKATGREKESCRVVISGAGSAGIAIAKILISFGVEDIVMCDSRGIISKNRKDLNSTKQKALKYTNPENSDGELHDAIAGRDVFVGVSAPGILNSNDISTMADNSIIFAMSNPEPEIHPQDAQVGGAKIVATGRSDYPNQINNVLAFPGIFRGALDVRAREINEEMKLAVAYAIAGLVSDGDITKGLVIPSPFDSRVAEESAMAAAKAAIATGVAGTILDETAIRDVIRSRLT
ncbi:MAG: NAD-dependent malic enzyme [Spirochaetales bacterium]|nr:NAD-dependent malic enzyme [Spirochaetales bacterium]